MHSYTEVSPSGKGLRILFRAEGFVYDKERYYVVNHKQGLEVYIAGATQRYVTVTGNRVNDYPFGERGAELQQVLERYMRQPEKPKNSGINGLNGFFGKMDYFPKMLSDEELLQKAMSSRMGAEFQRLWNGDITGYKSQSEADMALCSSLAFWTGRNEEQMDRLFRKSGLMRKKWDRSQSGSTYGAITIRKAVERCRSIYQITEKKVMTPSQEETENPVENVKNTTPDVQAAMSKGFQPFVKLEPQKNHLPPFPIDALPAPLRDCVKAVSLNSQTSPDMAAVIGLGCLAVCLQGKYQVEAGSGYCEPLSLYTVVIASPGERKSSVLNRMTKPIYDFEIAYNKAREPERMENQRRREKLQRKIAGLKSRLERREDEETEQELREAEDELAALPELMPLRLYADDCSSEALTSLLARNGGVFSVISSEGGIFDIMAGRYSSKANMEVWLKGHCGDSIRVDRLGREAEYIPHPALSTILAIQPSVLSDIMSNTAMGGRGLLARFLYASPASCVGKRKFSAPPIPYDVWNRYVMMINGFLTEQSVGAKLKLSERAVEIISDCFEEHEIFMREDGAAIADWANKYIGTVLRIAGLLHVGDGETEQQEISASVMHRAIEIGRYFLAHASYAYALIDSDETLKKADFIMKKVMKKQITSMKRSELYRMCRSRFFEDAESMMPTLELLENHGYIRIEEPEMRKGPGRTPSIQIRINPEVYREAEENK